MLPAVSEVIQSAHMYAIIINIDTSHELALLRRDRLRQKLDRAEVGYHVVGSRLGIGVELPKLFCQHCSAAYSFWVSDGSTAVGPQALPDLSRHFLSVLCAQRLLFWYSDVLEAQQVLSSNTARCVSPRLEKPDDVRLLHIL